MLLCSVQDDLKINKANQKIVNAIVKNCKNGEWKIINLKPEDCKVGDVVLDFNKSICEIKEVKHNSNERGEKCHIQVASLHLFSDNLHTL
jgi:hypothetical protein